MLTPTASSVGVGRVLLRELEPYPERLGLSWRMAVLCMAVVAISMWQHIPEAALSCYLIFFAAKDNAGSCIAIGIALILGATIAIALAVVFFMFSADQPFLRLMLVIVFTFGGMYLSQASRLGPTAATIGFVFAFAITLFDYVPLPELLVRALTSMWKVVFVPMVLLVLLNVFAGRKPTVLMRQLVARRLEAQAHMLRTGTPAARQAVRALLDAGNRQARTWERMAGIFSPLSRQEIRRLGDLVDVSYELMAIVVAACEEGNRLMPSAAQRDALAQRMADIAHTIRTTRRFGHAASSELGTVPFTAAPVIISKPLGRLQDLLSGQCEPRAIGGDTERESFLRPDAFSNPDHVRFALKTVLAVMICYFTYTTLGWFEIHTAMITCFYVALGNTANTVHKLTLRIVGCLLGAAMGVFSILFLMPHMTDIGHLMLLVGGGSFIAAWVANGSEHIAYMGWQMALAFFLCVLHGFGPSFDLAVASDRIMGIVIGNVVVAIIFSNLWPVSAVSTIKGALAKAMSGLALLAKAPRSTNLSQGAYMEQAYTCLADAERESELLVFEPLAHPRRKDIAELRRLLAVSKGLVSPLVLIGVQERSAQLSRQLPRPIEVAENDFEQSLADWLAASAERLASSLPAGGPNGSHPSLERVNAAFKRNAREAEATEALSRPIKERVAERLHIHESIDVKLAALSDTRLKAGEFDGGT